jgi:hypothetical protein
VKHATGVLCATLPRQQAVAGSSNGTALASTSASAAASPVLVLSVGHTVFRTLLETAEREGVDVNALALGLLMLGLGRQAALVQTRRSVDPSTMGIAVVCINCARPRAAPNEPRCSVCGGGWCTGFG